MTYRTFLSLILAGCLLAGCGRPEAPPIAAAAADTLDATRIVSMGGPITEIVYALGLGDRIVGTDLSSLYPAEIQSKPRLGYFRQASAEGIVSVRPTLVIALDGLGPPAVADQVRAAGVSVYVLPEAETLEDAEARVEAIGRLLAVEDAAAELVRRMRSELAEATAHRPAPGIRALFVYARGAGVVQVSGSQTAAETMMTLAGLENAISEFEGFRPLTAEAVITAAPDVIVMPTRGMESLGGWEGLLKQPGLAQTPAGRNGRIIAVDDAILLGLGPRVGEGVRAMVASINAQFPPASLP